MDWGDDYGEEDVEEYGEEDGEDYGEEMTYASDDSSLYSEESRADHMKFLRASHTWTPCVRTRRASFGCDDLIRSREETVEHMIETHGYFFWCPDDSYMRRWRSIITQYYHTSIFYARKYHDVVLPDVFDDIKQATETREREEAIRRMETKKRKHRGKKQHARKHR